MYINDIAESIQSNIRLVDTNFQSNQSDCQSLQKDLTKLETWEQELLMAFNPDKGEVIRITNKRIGGTEGCSPKACNNGMCGMVKE